MTHHVNEREEVVVALHLPTRPLKTCSGLEPVLRCEPSTDELASAPFSPATVGQHPTRSKGPCCPCKDLKAQMGIRAYFKSDVKYFSPLAYDSVTIIALFE